MRPIGHFSCEGVDATHLHCLGNISGEKKDMEDSVGGKPVRQLPGAGVAVVDDFEAGEALTEDCFGGEVLVTGYYIAVAGIGCSCATAVSFSSIIAGICR